MTERFTKERIDRLLWMVENDTESTSVYVALVALDEIIKQLDEIELLQSERQTWMDKADKLQQRTIAQHQEMERLMNEVKESNSLLRSARAISLREGKETNWDAFKKQVDITLDRQYKIMHERNNKNETSNL